MEYDLESVVLPSSRQKLACKSLSTPIRATEEIIIGKRKKKPIECPCSPPMLVASSAKKKRWSAISGRSNSSPLRKATPVKLEDTITLDSSKGTDVIDSSIIETPSKFDWIQTPRSIRSGVGNTNSLGLLSKRNSFIRTQKTECLIKDSNIVLTNNYGSIKDPSALPLLDRRKQRTIEKWLMANNQRMNSASKVSNQLHCKVSSTTDKPLNISCTDVKVSRRNNIAQPLTDIKIRPPLFTENDTETAKPSSTSKSKLKSNNRKARRKIFSDEDPGGSDVLLDDLNGIEKITDVVGTPVLSISPKACVLPKKTPRRKRKRSVSTEGSDIPSITQTPVLTATSSIQLRPTTTPRRTFLASLSVSSPSSVSHPEARPYKLNFASKKDELVRILFKLYNSEVFENKLPIDFKITWNTKLRGTAGFCYNQKRTKGAIVTRVARIELATKVVDRAERLRDTLIHELCHASAWIVDGVLDGHGDVWLRWTRRAMERFPELPDIKRCHNYEIATKFTYQCTECGYSINRNSKSIDVTRKCCGICGGLLELLVNKKRRGKTEQPEFDQTRTVKEPKGFALFVKENYKKVKVDMPNKKHAEIMSILGQQFAVFKNVFTPVKN